MFFWIVLELIHNGMLVKILLALIEWTEPEIEDLTRNGGAQAFLADLYTRFATDTRLLKFYYERTCAQYFFLPKAG